MGTGREELFQPHGKRSITPVVAHHERKTTSLVGLLNGCQLLVRKGERLLYEHMLAQLQRLCGQGRVGVVASQDEHAVSALIIEHLLGLRTTELKSVLFAQGFGAHPCRRRNAPELDTVLLGK